MSKVLILKNHHLPLLKRAMSYAMKFQKGRIRNRFMKLIEEKGYVVEKNRIELVEAFSVTDKKTGRPVVKDGKYEIQEGKQAKFDKEYVDLMNEECIIDILPSTEKDLGDIKQIINDTPLQLEEFEVSYLEDVLTAFNEIGPLPEKAKVDKKKKK